MVEESEEAPIFRRLMKSYRPEKGRIRSGQAARCGGRLAPPLSGWTDSGPVESRRRDALPLVNLVNLVCD